MAEERVIFPPKKIPTKVKHWILERCLSAWGGIIVNSNPREVKLSFIDTCCGSGLYQTSHGSDDRTYDLGSALIGPTKLREILEYAQSRKHPARARALLINSDRQELRTAHEAIGAAGLDKDIPIEYREETLDAAREIVLNYCKGWFTFAFIDPYGPSPTPFSVVSSVVEGRFTDTLINFPFHSLEKWTGFLGRPDLQPDERAKLEAADAFMAGPTWQDVALNARKTGKPLHAALVGHYLKQLSALGVHALSLPLWFEHQSRVIYHLIFTSHNIAGLASAKQKFIEGETKQFQLRQEAETRHTGQLSLLDSSSPSPVDLNALGRALCSRFAGTTIPLEDVILVGLQQPRVLESDIRKALTSLKKQALVKYSGKRWSDPITFAVPSVRTS